MSHRYPDDMTLGAAGALIGILGIIIAAEATPLVFLFVAAIAFATIGTHGLIPVVSRRLAGRDNG